MNKFEYGKMYVDKYFDRELNREEEIKLFESLASDENLRIYFKQLSEIEREIKSATEDFPEKLEERIFSQISVKESGRMKEFINPLIRYAAVIVFILLTGFLLFRNNDYRDLIEENNQQIKQQEKLINNLMNTIPPVEVSPKKEEAVVIIKRL